MRALTLQVFVDDIEGEEEGIADSILDSYTISSMPRPGTSLKTANTIQQNQGIRPKTNLGKPVTGTIRPATQSSITQNMEQTLRVPRTAMTARPITANSGRVVRYLNN